MGGFVNCSNHPSGGWLKAQKDAAEKYGTITDVAEDETTDETATDSNTAESSDSTETTADGETQTAN